MLKKKPIYIAGIILFTLILILDVAIYLTAPKNTAGFDESGFGGMPQGGFTMPEGFDSSNIPDMGEIPEGLNPSELPNGGEMPEGFNPSQMPEGFDTSEIPNMGELPEGFDASQLPEGFNPSDMSGMMQPPQENSLLASIRSAFVPILLAAIIGDVMCAVMLVVIGKKKSEEPEAVEQAHIDYNLPL